MTTTDNRWHKSLGSAAALVVRRQLEDGHIDPGKGWEPLSILFASSSAVGQVGMSRTKKPVPKVDAAVRVYARTFLPWGWTLEPPLEWDARALAFTRGDERITDFLWIETWDTPLPATAHFADIPGRVRVLDLIRPFASREYINGTHVPLRVGR